MHRGQGWGGIGYHAVIRRNGDLELGRGWGEIGVHVGRAGHNHDSVGVCLVGGLDEDGDAAPEYDPRQLETLRIVIDGLRNRYPSARVIGHRDFSPDLDGDGVVERHEFVKMCPSFDARKWYLDGTVEA